MNAREGAEGALTAEQVADSIRDDAWRATSLRLDDALGRRGHAPGSKRVARDPRPARSGGVARPRVSTGR